MPAPITIDGSRGEGGGQILRSALALSLATGTPLRIENVRGGRSRPGLLRQHLACIRLAQEVGHALVEGAELGSAAFAFEPRALRGGLYEAHVGTAGSVQLVVQSVLPALLRSDEPSELVIEGGTYAKYAPPFEHMRDVLFPLLARTGARLEATIERHGFYPRGGGRIRVRIEPARSSIGIRRLRPI